MFNQSIIPSMAIVAEELIYCPKIRLFGWNEKLVDKKNLLNDSPSLGLCLFEIISANVSITHHPDSSEFSVRESPNRNYDRVSTFDLGPLLLSSSAADDGHDLRDEDRLLELATALVAGTSLFPPENAAELGSQIVAHFANDYELKGSDNVLASSSIGRGPRFVMVVQIRAFRWFEFTGTQPRLAPVFEALTFCNGEHRHQEKTMNLQKNGHRVKSVGTITVMKQQRIGLV